MKHTPGSDWACRNLFSSLCILSFRSSLPALGSRSLIIPSKAIKASDLKIHFLGSGACTTRLARCSNTFCHNATTSRAFPHPGYKRNLKEEKA